MLKRTLGTAFAFGLAFSIAGCSIWQNIVQGTQQSVQNKANATASNATSNMLNSAPSTPSTPAVPTSADAASAATGAVPAGAPGAVYVGDIRGMNTPACKGAKDGPCKSYIDQGNAGNIGATFCGAACVQNLCGMSAQAQVNAANAKANGFDCNLGN